MSVAGAICTRIAKRNLNYRKTFNEKVKRLTTRKIEGIKNKSYLNSYYVLKESLLEQ